MKKRFNKNKLISIKSVILVAVSLVLVIITAVGTTASWIEEVSQVDFNSNDGQQTPLHVGSKKLNSDMVIKQDPTADVINLSDYFYKSGDMHLSPCYGDGEKFYFPVENGTTGFREGTKDDVNVNYMSATFRIRSEGEKTAYWFEKSGENNNTPYITFGKQTDEGKITPASNDTNADLTQYLRCSVTIDGTTNVYALNDSGKFKTVDTSRTTPVYEDVGRRIDQYTYYQEALNNSNPVGYYKNSVNVTGKPNQGVKENLNGNTLFIVNKYDSSNKTTIKTVTVKIWLEYNNYTSDSVDVASINMNFVSSWAKTRRIYVKDATENQLGYSAAKWLTTTTNISGTDVTPTLRWALKDNPSKNWLLEKISGTDYYYVDVPAVYNNEDVVLFRSANFTSNQYNQTKYGDYGDYYYWDKWETKFPDTFHSEIYTVCTNDFGTWETSPNKVYFLNSCSFETPRAYMWDKNFGEMKNGIVENAKWPGVTLTKLKETISSADYYTFYYNSDYSNIIFSNGLDHGGNWEHQSEDITTVRNVEGQTFDMTTLMWYNATPSSHSNLPKYADFSDTYIDTSLATGHNDFWTHLNLCYEGIPSYSGDQSKFTGTNVNNLLCRFYSKYGASGSNSLQLVLHVNGKTYKRYEGSDTLDLSSTDTIELYEENDNNNNHKNLYITNVSANAIYSIYVTKTNNGYNVKLVKDT